jgi:hypothetical protein
MLLTDLSWREFPEIICDRYSDSLKEFPELFPPGFFLPDFFYRKFFTKKIRSAVRKCSQKNRPDGLLFYRYPGLRSNNRSGHRHPGCRPISPSVVFRTPACRSARLCRTDSIHLGIIASRSWPSGICRTSRTVITAARQGVSAGDSLRILAICMSGKSLLPCKVQTHETDDNGFMVLVFPPPGYCASYASTAYWCKTPHPVLPPYTRKGR